MDIQSVAEETGKQIQEGLLRCTNSACQREYPIIDGVPIIIGPIRQFIAEHVNQIVARRDLSSQLESLITDCCGPGSEHETVRQHLSSYAFDHYGDLDPCAPEIGAQPCAITRVLAAAIEPFQTDQSTPTLDVGCSVGRTTFELAKRFAGLTLGVDLNFPMLRLAQHVLSRGTVCYDRRRVGVVYDRCEFDVQFANAELVDFWCCDALVLPFADGQFRSSVCLNVLDCVQNPFQLLQELSRTLGSDGRTAIASPYDWSPSATQLEAWLGGHSDRAEHRGASEPVLRQLLTDKSVRLRIDHEVDNVDWQVRLHERSWMNYREHIVACTKDGPTATSSPAETL